LNVSWGRLRSAIEVGREVTVGHVLWPRLAVASVILARPARCPDRVCMLCSTSWLFDATHQGGMGRVVGGIFTADCDTGRVFRCVVFAFWDIMVFCFFAFVAFWYLHTWFNSLTELVDYFDIHYVLCSRLYACCWLPAPLVRRKANSRPMRLIIPRLVIRSVKTLRTMA